MAKPAGPLCNLDCKYCFYLEKADLYPDERRFEMPDEVLETYIRQYIASQSGEEISFAWQGGEPLLRGLGFFERVVELQKAHCPPGRRIANGLQTNALLLDRDWCRFFERHDFLLGISVDGPADLHDAYRVDKGQKPTFDAVMLGVELCRDHGIRFNTLTVVNRLNSKRPLEVYDFLKSIGSRFHQYVPLVERVEESPVHMHDLAAPPGLATEAAHVTEWSLIPEDYGEFLCAIYDHWITRDVGEVFVQLFDVMLGIWYSGRASLCLFSQTCGRGMALEHNGDLYACDHYVYPEHLLGNIVETDMVELANLPQQHAFGQDKGKLPAYCRACDVRFACQGECPKHRFARTRTGELGLNYFCAAYERFFSHIDPTMRAMCELLDRGQPASMIMRGGGPGVAAAPKKVGRNAPCPCGSGRKFKRCCG